MDQPAESAEQVRTETAKELGLDASELDYVDEDFAAMTDEVAEAEQADAESEEVDGQLLNSFDCRRPAYRYINSRWWLYYYYGCTGGYYRILRSRVYSISATGYCGVPTRRFKVFYTS